MKKKGCLRDFGQDVKRAKTVFVAAEVLEDKFAVFVRGGENRKSSEKKETYKANRSPPAGGVIRFSPTRMR